MVDNDGFVIMERGWVTRAYCTIALEDDGEERLQCRDVTLAEQYVTAYYWAITTLSTVGYGDVTPKTFSERVFAICAEMFGCLSFAMLIGTLGSIMVGQKLLEEKVSKQRAELREFMEAKGIPKALRGKIRRFMETLYEQRSGFDEHEVLSQLPPAMAQELLDTMYRSQIEHVPMFQAMEEGAITKICMMIKPFLAMKDDHVYAHGAIGREIFIIISGAVEISFPFSSNKVRNTTQHLQKGGLFGEGCVEELFKNSGDAKSYKREDTAVAETDCDLKFLTLADLHTITNDFPSTAAPLRNLAQEFGRVRRRSAPPHPTAATRPRQRRTLRRGAAQRKPGEQLRQGRGGHGRRAQRSAPQSRRRDSPAFVGCGREGARQ